MSNPIDWHSHRIEFREFPPLQSGAANGRHKRRNNPQRLNLSQPPKQWPNREPSVPEWSADDVSAANESMEDVSAFDRGAASFVELEVKTVDHRFPDPVTATTRYELTGYGEVAAKFTKLMLSTTRDPTERFRSLVLDIPVTETDPTKLTLSVPRPSAAPNWRGSLPDQVLNEEYRFVSYIRSLNISLGPRALECLLRQCPYNAIESRRLPIYKSDRVAAPPSMPQKPTRSMSQTSQQSDAPIWKGPSNDVRLSGSSAASTSTHQDQPSQCGKQIKSQGMMESRNASYSRPSHKDHRGGDCTANRESRYGTNEERGSSRSEYNHEWDDCYGDYRKSQSKRYVGYERHNASRRSEDRGDYNHRDDSGYHGEHEKEDYGSERSETSSVSAEPVDRPVTQKKTLDWKADYTGWKEEKRVCSKADKWTAKWTDQRPVKKERSRGQEELLEDPPVTRHFWKSSEVPPSVRRAFRCLEGALADSCTAFADDMHRVELSAWVGDEDAAEVAAMTREKYGLGVMEREMEERRVLLALPRTSITLAVGAGGDADILFDNDCCEVLVKGRSYDDIRAVVTERVVKARDFISYEANRHQPAYPHQRTHTVLSFDSADESRIVRDTLRQSGEIDAKKMPRDLITGNWDGQYAQRECILELKWDRYGINGFNVRFYKLQEQANFVDELMRHHSVYFTNSHVNIEECFNRMWVSTSPSPYTHDEDMRFLKALLEENGVEVAGICSSKSKDKPQTIDSREKQAQCRLAINRRILKMAIDEGVWGGFHPRSPEEWRMMLEEARFSWIVEVPIDTVDAMRSGENSATVIFDSFEQGERIAARVQRMTPCGTGEHTFILNKEDRKGVFARTKLRVHYNVPVMVHAFTCRRLKELDDAWRTSSHFSREDFGSLNESTVQWACLISDDKTTPPPGFCRLIVEGFPRSTVEDCCEQLLAVIRGDVIECEGDEEWLLTGIGRNMADALAKEALEKKSVLVDFNVLGKEIRLIGEKKDTALVEATLRRLARNRRTHEIETLVTVHQPVYMNRTCEAILAFGGIYMLNTVIGECTITACDEDADKRTLRFNGTVAAYDRLRDFLGDLDDILRESANAAYEKQRKTDEKLQDPSLSPLTSALLCPICHCRPSTDFYRLEACGHVYCSHCIYHQLTSELATRTLPLKCSREGCGRKLAVSDLLRLLLGRDPETAPAGARAEHLDEMKLRPLVNAIITNALQTKRDKVIACRTADCAGIFPRLKESNVLVRCKCCQKTACGACGYEPHSGYECDEYEELRDNVNVSIASYMKNKKVRKCPNKNCSAVIEKTVGCNHMECVICRTHFCWLCGYASSTQGEIYSHMQNDHGGNGLHMEDGEMFMLQFDD